MKKIVLLAFIVLSFGMPVNATDPLTKDYLNDLQQRVEHVIQQSAECGSLLTSEAARDLELLLNGLRQGLNEDLDKQWTKLGSFETKLLGDSADQIQHLDDAVATGGKIEENTYLDADQLLPRPLEALARPFVDQHRPTHYPIDLDSRKFVPEAAPAISSKTIRATA